MKRNIDGVLGFVFLFFILCTAEDRKEWKQDEDPQQQPRSKRKSDYLTEYACEGSRLHINCTGEGEFIDVIRANYGRFSISVCNQNGNTDWSVNCMSPRTLRVIKARCGNQLSCDVPVDSTIFGDPCPGTHKYVEVHYACRNEPALLTPTPRPRPPWFPSDSSSATNAWSSISNHLNGLKSNKSADYEDSTDDPEDSEDESILPEEEQNRKLSEGLGTTTTRVIEVRVPRPIDIGGISPRRPNNPHLPIQLPATTTTAKAIFRPGTSTTTVFPPNSGDRTNHAASTTTERMQVLVNFTQYCPPATARGLFWNWTKSGDTAVLQCPSGSSGFAKWHCSDESLWAAQSPSLAECRSLWLVDLEARLREGVPVTNVSRSLAYYSGLSTAAGLYGGDVAATARMLKHVAERMHYQIQRTPSHKTRESLVKELVQSVVATGSHLLDRKNHRGWADLSDDEVAQAATALMIGLEDNAFLLAEEISSEKIAINPTENILLSIRVMQAHNAAHQRFPSGEATIEPWGNGEEDGSGGDSIELAMRSLLSAGASDGAVRIVFTAFHQLDRLLSPKNPGDGGYFINSKVVSASLGRHMQRLAEPAKITFRHLRTFNVSSPRCVYWDLLSSGWAADGCHVEASNRSHTRCLCSHLTNFALLMKEGGSDDEEGGGGGDGGFDSPIAALPSSPTTRLAAHVSTIVAGVAALISLSVLAFFAAMAWRRLKMTGQCRSALERSGLPCFHKGKDLVDKDKGNRGNFYTVTPKLNGAGNAAGANANANAGGNRAETVEVAEAQQFFEHMISLQKNQDTLVPGSKRRSSGLALANEQQQQQEGNNVTEDAAARPEQSELQRAPSEGVYPRRNFVRALSPYNHIYMEIDPTDEHLGSGAVYEPLTHSETYMMSTVSDRSEECYNGGHLHQASSDVSRQSSSRESRPLIGLSSGRRTLNPNLQVEHANLLQTISGVLHSQSVRIAPSAASATLNPARRSSALMNRNIGVSGTQTIGRRHPLGAGIPMQLVTTTPGQAFPENSILSRLALEQQRLNEGTLAPTYGSSASDTYVPVSSPHHSTRMSYHNPPLSSRGSNIAARAQFAQPLKEVASP